MYAVTGLPEIRKQKCHSHGYQHKFPSLYAIVLLCASLHTCAVSAHSFNAVSNVTSSSLDLSCSVGQVTQDNNIVSIVINNSTHKIAWIIQNREVRVTQDFHNFGNVTGLLVQGKSSGLSLQITGYDFSQSQNFTCKISKVSPFTKVTDRFMTLTLESSTVTTATVAATVTSATTSSNGAAQSAKMSPSITKTASSSSGRVPEQSSFSAQQIDSSSHGKVTNVEPHLLYKIHMIIITFVTMFVILVAVMVIHHLCSKTDILFLCADKCQSASSCTHVYTEVRHIEQYRKATEKQATE